MSKQQTFDRNKYDVTLKDAFPMVLSTIRAGRVPMLESAPGMGKSAFFRAVAAELDLLLVDERFAGYDPTDLQGFPSKDASGKFARYLPFTTIPLKGVHKLPRKEGVTAKQVDAVKAVIATENAKASPDQSVINSHRKMLDDMHYKGWLLLADELPSAKESVQAASYKLFLDRMVGQYEVHPNCHLAAAGNGIEHGAIAGRIGTALQSRMVWYGIKHDVNHFVEVVCNDIGIHPVVTAFVEANPESIKSFDPRNPDRTFCCNRTTEFLSDLYKDVVANPATINGNAITEKDSYWIPHWAGAVGQIWGIQFQLFLQIFSKLPTFDEIVQNPTGVAMPTEPSEIIALTAMLAEKTNSTNSNQVFQFVGRVPSTEFEASFVRKLVAVNPDMKQDPHVHTVMMKLVQLMSTI